MTPAPAHAQAAVRAGSALADAPLARPPPPPPSPPRTKWTRRVPHPVLIGHAASLTPYCCRRHAISGLTADLASAHSRIDPASIGPSDPSRDGRAPPAPTRDPRPRAPSACAGPGRAAGARRRFGTVAEVDFRVVPSWPEAFAALRGAPAAGDADGWAGVAGPAYALPGLNYAGAVWEAARLGVLWPSLQVLRPAPRRDDGGGPRCAA